MGDVAHIRKEDVTDAPAAEPVFPGVEAAIVQQIDTNRTLSMKTLFLRDAKPNEHEFVLASLFSVAAVTALREKVIENKRERANAEARLKDLDFSSELNPARVEKIKAEITELRQDLTVFRTDDERKFRESRSGEYRPAGVAKNTMAKYDADIAKKEAELKDLERQLADQKAALVKAIQNYTLAIENAESEIAIRRQAYGER